MCLVEVEKTPKLKVACTLPVAEGMVVHTDSPQVPPGAQRHARIPADQPSARLPGVRQGRRVRTAGHGVPLRRGREPLHRNQAPRGREAMVAGGVLRRAALHSLLPLRAHLQRRHGRGCAGRRSIAASFREIAPNKGDHLECDECGTVHRYLPGGRADQRHLSLSDAAVGDGARRHHLHALLERLQDHAGRAQRRDHPRQQPRPLRHQRRVPVHQGPLRVRFLRSSGAACSRR